MSGTNLAPLVVSLSNHVSGSERPTVAMPANAGTQRGDRDGQMEPAQARPHSLTVRGEPVEPCERRVGNRGTQAPFRSRPSTRSEPAPYLIRG